MTLRPVARLLGDVRRSAGPAPAGNASTGTDKWSAPPSGLVASFPQHLYTFRIMDTYIVCSRFHDSTTCG